MLLFIISYIYKMKFVETSVLETGLCFKINKIVNY